MALIDIIYGKYKVISIVGMAKNAGKTVTLNHLIEEAAERDITLGLTSIGRDGENLDVVTATEKPMIYVYEGTYIATSEKTLNLGDAKIEIIKVTNYRTPMGKIVIGKVRQSGYVQIAGPQTSKEVREISDKLVELGSEIVLVDGALNRLSSASPSISEGCVLATGAVVSRDMNKVIRNTLHTLGLFRLPKVQNKTLRELVNDTIKSGKVVLIDKSLNVETLNIKTSLNSGRIIGQNITDNTKAIVFSGSLVKKTVEDIMKSSRRYKDIIFIVRDGTKIFINSSDWIRLTRSGLKVKTLNQINTLAITLNPYSPQGYYFDQKEFLEKTKMFIKDVPVFDVLQGGEDYESIFR